MMEETVKVIKIGGNVVDNPEALARFIAAFAAMPGKKILVHGGGKEATRMSARLEIPTTMGYAGLVNKRIVSMLQAAGCNAIGLTGADGNSICATRRKPEPIDYGFVGDIAPSGVNAALIGSLLDAGLTPVFCAITHDGKGSLLNCNADTIASAVATGVARIAPVELVYCFEQPGVMEDIDRPDSVIPLITPEIYARLRAEGVVSKGMIPKIDNAFTAVNAGVKSVTIKHSDALDQPSGTVIRN